MKIAYQGEPGAFSEAATLRIAPEAQVLPCKSFEEVFTSVEGGPAHYGVLPVENSIGGSIHRNYDLLLEQDGRALLMLPIVSNDFSSLVPSPAEARPAISPETETESTVAA